MTDANLSFVKRVPPYSGNIAALVVLGSLLEKIEWPTLGFLVNPS
jgi:hypothetical protein